VEVEYEQDKVEKVIFESQPKHYVTGALFVPDPGRFRPPYPGVIEPVGHSFTAKAREIYQSLGALLALNGMVALVFDPIDQGERGQMLSQWPSLSGTKAHTTLGVGSMLLGRNTARFEIWDGMRAIDYLQSRPEVDPTRIGCAGLSGGGTQTSHLMATDERIKVAAPACYLTNFERLLATIGPQDAEQNIFGQLAFGMDHADYIMMRAPRPTLICAATGDFFDISGTWTSFDIVVECDRAGPFRQPASQRRARGIDELRPSQSRRDSEREADCKRTVGCAWRARRGSVKTTAFWRTSRNRLFDCRVPSLAPKSSTCTPASSHLLFSIPPSLGAGG
jgi:dienelactone hydrolase